MMHHQYRHCHFNHLILQVLLEAILSSYQIFRFYHDIRKYAFVPNIINIWNSLPGFVVKVDFIDVFKKRLDKYWSYQDFMFDYTAEIAGIGDRSELTFDIDLS